MVAIMIGGPTKKELWELGPMRGGSEEVLFAYLYFLGGGKSRSWNMAEWYTNMSLDILQDNYLDHPTPLNKQIEKTLYKFAGVEHDPKKWWQFWR